ncbi:hypothetical protein [Metabacillus arenae]|uniref:Uncharacterized protein n=1 Tax=Metabacillus arenae TaxID=2771434 RepID=A0A926RZJ2_9BACI|nr:hypothetical protein [Metabacillus arenae]MBD1379114.1 hypothetical protein [Metabacillus arenae]
MISQEKIINAVNAGLKALKCNADGDKRKALYYADHVKDDIQAAIHLLLAEIEEDESEDDTTLRSERNAKDH